MERPKKCYIRAEWFEAVSYMSKEDRCDFYESLLSFVYYGKRGDTLPSHIRGMFELCRQSLEKDVQAYEQKSIINRQNGSNGGRPQRDITQKNPDEPKKPKDPIHIHIHNIQEKEVLQTSLSTIVEREKKILIELFARGAIMPIEETQKMVNYYDARGWVDKGGNQIVDESALAKVWKCQDTSTYFANVRQKWAVLLRILPADMPHELCTDFIRMEQRKSDGSAIIYHKNNNLPKIIENNYLPQLKSAAKIWGVTGIEYRQQLSNS